MNSKNIILWIITFILSVALVVFYINGISIAVKWIIGLIGLVCLINFNVWIEDLDIQIRNTRKYYKETMAGYAGGNDEK